MTNLSRAANQLLQENDTVMHTVQFSRSELASIGATMATALVADIVPDDARPRVQAIVDKISVLCQKDPTETTRRIAQFTQEMDDLDTLFGLDKTLH